MAALTTADKWRHGHIAQSSKSVRNNYNWQSHKYVYIATYQSDSKSNPNPNPNPTPAAKQHPRRRNEFEGGEPVQRKAPEIFLVVSLHFFTLKVQLVVLVSNFVMVSTVLSVSCWLFFYTYSGPPCPVICKSCGHVPPCAQWTRRHWAAGSSKRSTKYSRMSYVGYPDKFMRDMLLRRLCDFRL